MDSIYIVGAGGIGCTVGYALCAAGLRVTFVEAEHEKVRWGRVHGVRVDRKRPYPAEFELFEEWRPAPGAVVFLCTKCYDNPAVLTRLSESAGPSATLIPIQNGFDPLLENQGGDWEGIASFVSECLPHRTHTRITRGGKLHFGQRGARGEGRVARDEHQEEWRAGDVSPLFLPDRATPWIQALRHSRVLARLRIKVEVVPNILPYKYTKLMYNAAISPLAAAAGLDNGQLLAVSKARCLFFEQIQENHAILRRAGIPLGKVGPFHPDTVQRILARPILANVLAVFFYPTLRRSYCSMSGDLPKGQTEIEFYNRHLIDLAGEHPCPRNRRVYQLIKRMERERTPPGLHVLDELLL